MKTTENERIKNTINQLGILQKHVASLLEVDTSTVSNWLRDGNQFPDDKLREYCETFLINYKWMKTGEGIIYPNNVEEAVYNAKQKIKILKAKPQLEKTGMEKALELLEDQLRKKDEQIATLLNVVSKLNFLNAPSDNGGLEIGSTQKSDGLEKETELGQAA